MNADEDTTVHVPAPTQLAMSVSANVLCPLCPNNFVLMVLLGFWQKIHLARVRKTSYFDLKKNVLSPQTQLEIFLFKNIQRCHTYQLSAEMLTADSSW